ncbi:MAG: hypothetical protein ACE5R6_07640 [Candidatus Heimdallarchaeota archaeon]
MMGHLRPTAPQIEWRIVGQGIFQRDIATELEVAPGCPARAAQPLHTS